MENAFILFNYGAQDLKKASIFLDEIFGKQTCYNFLYRFQTEIIEELSEEGIVLHDVTAVISADGLQISNALVSTYGEHVVDVFYVKDVFGMKVDRGQRLEKLRAALLNAITANIGKYETINHSAAE